MSEQVPSNERCINWPCAMRKGHVGPCSTSPEQRSSNYLLACPFCGGTPRMATEYDPDGVKWHYITCLQCGARIRGQWHSPGNDCPLLRAEVRDQWNRRASVEPSAGVKCTHCNGKGYNEPIYDEQDGWIDETPCETCNGSGRITTVEQYLKTLPANWHEDSSLETWFPITAEELKRLKDERASQPPTGSFCQRDTHPTHGGAIENETAKANAPLAAAAPEMLEALKFLVEVFGPGVDSFGPGAGPGEIDSIAAARAAIEKATAVS